MILNALPSQKESSIPDIAVHIFALHAASKIFICTESSNKMKLALWRNAMKIGILYNIGNEVTTTKQRKDQLLSWVMMVQ